jgi:uncharacterized protein with HEPN domain
MEHDPRKYLYDISESALLIIQFTESKTIDDYKNDVLLRSAVERQFQIIGEALQQLIKRFPNLADKISWHRNIIDFRHILVHGYDQIESEIVWGIIDSRLPVLLVEVDSLLKTD